MRTETIKFIDPFTGDEAEETFYFGLTEPEMIELNFEHERGLESFLAKIIAEEDAQKILAMFKHVIMLSLGERDGFLHVKTERYKTYFEMHPAYPVLYMKMLENAEYAAEFINDCMPKSMRDRAAAAEAAQKAAGTDKPVGPPPVPNREG
jgi:hypothetical protein